MHPFFIVEYFFCYSSARYFSAISLLFLYYFPRTLLPFSFLLQAFGYASLRYCALAIISPLHHHHHHHPLFTRFSLLLPSLKASSRSLGLFFHSQLKPLTQRDPMPVNSASRSSIPVAPDFPLIPWLRSTASAPCPLAPQASGTLAFNFDSSVYYATSSWPSSCVTRRA